MSEVSVQNRIYYNENSISAFICNTPITKWHDIDDYDDLNGRCELVTSVTQLIELFGDPFVNPSNYPELTIAYRILEEGIPVYVSSVYEMKDYDDGFETPYNGYTEFTFKDKFKHPTIKYKLKSNIKMCQPIIQSSRNLDTLTLYVQLYILRRDLLKDKNTINVIDPTTLYKTITINLDINSTTDEQIINILKQYGLELQIINGGSTTSLIDAFKDFSTFIVSLNEDSTDYYKYNLHTDLYLYDFEDDKKIINEYFAAIDLLKSQPQQPRYICLGKLCKSSIITDTYTDNDSNVHTFVSKSYLTDADADIYIVIQNHLMTQFSNDSGVFLFINTPDISYASTFNMCSNVDEFINSLELLDNYNCDLYFGYVINYFTNRNNPTLFERMDCPVAVLSMYNIVINNVAYMTNSIENLNIPNITVKSIINESAATKLQNARCNSIVTFETGLPTIYGDRTLSRLPNLRYSHVARNFILIRRLVSEYLETRKFTLLDIYNVHISINNISSNILDNFVNSGILSKYNISYALADRTVLFTITLHFNAVAGSLNLNFTI